MIQQQLSTAAKELRTFCEQSATTMAQVSQLCIHLEEAYEASDAGRAKDAQHFLNLFWKVVREDTK